MRNELEGRTEAYDEKQGPDGGATHSAAHTVKAVCNNMVYWKR